MGNNRVLRNWIFPIIATLIFSAVWFYIKIPAINFKSPDLWIFIFVTILAYFIFRHLFGKKNLKKNPEVVVDESVENMSVNIGGKNIPLNFDKVNDKLKRKIKIFLAIVGFVILGFIVVWISSSQIFNADAYHNQLKVQNGDFKKDIAELPISQVPVVDKETAVKLGNRKLGEVVSLVSQFEVSDMYTQINFNKSPTRVSPLVYSDTIKWFTNQSQGIPYYVKINMATQETELVQLEKPMKYSPFDHFDRHLLRHLRFQYPTAMFDEPVFEVDDQGNPFWVVPCYDYEIGVLGGRDINQVLLVDACTGETKSFKMNEVPQWIDNAYPSDLLNTQADNWGKYSNGWINSLFGQRDVIKTTKGYNSVVIDDDLWMYTGVTSATGDQSNLGFILINRRTKETKYYKVNGANEESAMRSAEGKVQEKKYNAAFPILVNVADTPTYFLSLKDSAGLIKQYAYVSVEKYQIVGVGDTVSEAQDAYVKLLKDNGMTTKSAQSTEETGTITSLSSAIVDGNTNYFMRLNNEAGTTYIVPIGANKQLLPFLQVGNTVKVEYSKQNENEIKTVNRISLV